jgi:hypothetical protein
MLEASALIKKSNDLVFQTKKKVLKILIWQYF